MAITKGTFCLTNVPTATMGSFQSFVNEKYEMKKFPLDELSERLQISQQTLVRWVDRHLIDATLDWTLTEDNEELRVIKVAKSKLDELEAFAKEYREGLVSRKEARRILKMIDRKKVKKMVRAGDIETTMVDEEKRVLISSLEDHLISVEQGVEEE
ncbi:MAG: hypothetical protein GVY15_10890 [Bacteroidetes bacterium]|nr:hypothetical protein [Bacteroidota bacterium]